MQESDKYNQKKADRYRLINEGIRAKNPSWYSDEWGHIMSLEECKQYEKGWELYRKYYFSLWD